MRITKIEITDFRNYSQSSISFDKGINILYGNNGAGKTNIAEAIDYLTLGKSFRAESDNELIKFNQDFAKIEAEYFRNKNSEMKVVVSKEGKKFFVNGTELRKLSELSGNVIDVLFTPKDALLFKDSPGVRRKLVDITISSMDKKYLSELSICRNLLKDRNAALKEESIDWTYIDVINERLSEHQFYIVQKRKELLDEVNKRINEIYKKIDDEQNEIRIDYLSYCKETEENLFKKESLKKYDLSKETDMRRKSTGEGIHHEDFKTYLNGHEIDLYGSQGQNRLTCLALKLSVYEIIKRKINDDPILILDDVLSELDENHQTKLVNYLSQTEQTFITSAEMNENLEKYSVYEIKDNAVIRR